MDDKSYMQYFSQNIIKAVINIPVFYLDKIHEFRMRVNRPLAVTMGNNIKYLSYDGNFSNLIQDNTLIVSQTDINKMFDAICQYSIHSFGREISNGFITVNGGHRVGICGSAVQSNNDIQSIKNISGLNFRIAHQIFNCADALYNKVYCNKLNSLLIAGLPSCGKTTMLRDICRILGLKYKVSLIDERGELAAVYNGIPQNDIGINTDVLNGYSKAAGIETAVRVMSPHIIICDEIGNADDISAINYALNCGVKIIASIHADSLEKIQNKSINLNFFDYVAFLDNYVTGKINSIIRTDEYV